MKARAKQAQISSDLPQNPQTKKLGVFLFSVTAVTFRSKYLMRKIVVANIFILL
jgi:hypothetical protein